MDTATFASPYARVGAKLIDNGFSAIALLPGTKRPADFKWSQYCDNLPEDHKADAWSRMPNAGVGIACGFNGVVALDFDTDDSAIISAVESVVGESFIQKRGKRGFTGFYRASAPIESRGFSIRGSRVVDLLAEGRQTVIPPSIHPDTNKPYAWITPLGLEDALPEHLPLLPEDSERLIEKALEPFGYQQPAPKREYDCDSCDEAHDAAMGDFDAWVPHLGIPVFRTPNGYRAVATWRGGEEYNVGFAPQGIKDWVADEGFSPRGMVERALGLDSWDAGNWLRERFGMPVQSRAELEAFVKGFLESLRNRKAKAEDRAEAKHSWVSGALEFTRLDKIKAENRDWIVWGLLGKGEASTWYGDPSSGKSVVVGELAFHISHGLPWMGLDVVKTPVVYFPLERYGLITRRLQGLAAKHRTDAESDPYIAKGDFDIRDTKHTGDFIAGIKRAGAGVAIVDTYSRALNGGNENGPEDGGAAVANIQRIINKTGAHLLLIHHVGHAEDAKGRLRGWSGLNGAMDTTVLVKQPKKDGIVFWAVQKENDPLGGEKLPPHKVKLESHPTGRDGKGNVVSVPYLTLLSVGAGAHDDGAAGTYPKVDIKFKKPGVGEATAIKALGQALKERGYLPLEHEDGFPDDSATVSKDEWRDAYAKLRPGDADSNRQAFGRISKKLIESGRVNSRHNRVWLP